MFIILIYNMQYLDKFTHKSKPYSQEGPMVKTQRIFTLGTLESFHASTIYLPKHKQPTRPAVTQSQPCQTQSMNQISTISVSKAQQSQHSEQQAKKIQINRASMAPLAKFKYRYIKKQPKDREKNNAYKIKSKNMNGNIAKSDQKQTVLFKYFKRRIFSNSSTHQKITQKSHEKGKCFNMIKILDWQMQASKNLHLSKDAFYTAAAIAKNFYSNPRNQLFPNSIIQTQVASILSIAAKLQSNKVNYVQAISLICGFSSSDIIQAEVYVIKDIGFKIPFQHIQEQVIQVAKLWHRYISETANQIKLDIAKTAFGFNDLKQWDMAGKTNLIDYLSIVDMILLPVLFGKAKQQTRDIGYSPQKKYQNQNISLLLQSLFLFVCNKTSSLFPQNQYQKTYLTLLFQSFLAKEYSFGVEQYQQWINNLIRNQKQLDLIARVYRYFDQRNDYRMKQSTCFRGKYGHEQKQMDQTAHFVDVMPESVHQYFNQDYYPALLN